MSNTFRPATDTELAAAIEANSTPAAMVKLDCGDSTVIEGDTIELHDWTDCPEGCGNAQVVELYRTSIVNGI